MACACVGAMAVSGSDQPPRATPRLGAGTGARSGAILLTLFGLTWWLAAAAGMSFSGAVLWALTGAALAVVLGARALVVLTDGAKADLAAHRGTYRTVNLTQWVAIGLVVACCVTLGLQRLIAPLVLVVVGLHFWPFTRMYGWPGYSRIGLGLTGAGVVALVLVLAVPLAVPGSLTLTGTIAAVGLWSGVLALFRAAVPTPPASDEAN